MELDFLTLDDLVLDKRVVLVRIDINSPIEPETGEILDDTRLKSHATTIKDLVNENARIVLMSHQSRPGREDFTTLEIHGRHLEEILDMHIEYVDDIFGSKARESIRKLDPGEVLLLENTRFYSEENLCIAKNMMSSTHFIKKLSPLADYFINDAFSASHRAHLSVVGFTTVLPSAAGRVMEKEIRALDRVVKNPERPCIFLLGGVKADDSLRVIRNVLENDKADKILTTGVVANIFLLAKGVNIGKANVDFIRERKYDGLIEESKKLLKKYGDRISTPYDLAISKDGERVEVLFTGVPDDKLIHDIGLETIFRYSKDIYEAKTVVANGPAGIFEEKGFEIGTEELIGAIAGSKAFSVIGGGHLVAVAENANVKDEISHVSTGGGACITYLAGEPLPGLEALKEAAQRFKVPR
ncbi:MAG: phosphoglycerate kinase [Candidatus Hydrothermarchaeota archaeon]